MIYASLETEKSLWINGYQNVCGIDEVGRGSFAGPVVAAAVIFPQDVILPLGLADSKLLRPRQREQLVEQIRTSAQDYAIAETCVNDINKVGIGKATQMAFRKAIKSLKVRPDFILIDAFYIKHLSRKKQQAVKHGDRYCATIAAASIIAKVYRDELMKQLHRSYPQYGFGKHKGYGTKKHQQALKEHGLTKIHRTSFNLAKFTNLSS